MCRGERPCSRELSMSQSREERSCWVWWPEPVSSVTLRGLSASQKSRRLVDQAQAGGPRGCLSACLQRPLLRLETHVPKGPLQAWQPALRVGGPDLGLRVRPPLLPPPEPKLSGFCAERKPDSCRWQGKTWGVQGPARPILLRPELPPRRPWPGCGISSLPGAWRGAKAAGCGPTEDVGAWGLWAQ